MSRPIVLLGMMSRSPVAGVVWQTVQYLLGLRRLGFDPYYVEAHALAPSMLMRSPEDDGAEIAAQFVSRIMRRFDFADRWAYEALHADGRCYGLDRRRLMDLYAEAEVIFNLHGGTTPREEHSRTGRLVYIETDPVQLQIELSEGNPETLQFLEQHCAFFTFAENLGNANCSLPASGRFPFLPTRQPVCLDLWPVRRETVRASLTTIGNWRQTWRDVTFAGQVLTWSKDLQFEKVMELPMRTGRRFELALSGCPPEDKHRLLQAGWGVREASELSWQIDGYRGYIASSFGEFTVAKEQNVFFRTGWFSDRSATYLASGRPVITQETGFSEVLPTGAGLYAYSNVDEAASAVEAVCSDYALARTAARELAREYFSSDIVLGTILRSLGVSVGGRHSRDSCLASDLDIRPRSRRPLRLEDSVERRVRLAPFPFVTNRLPGEAASVVVVSYENLTLTRLCIESVLANTSQMPYELIVVDNASGDGTRAYLQTVARRSDGVRIVLNDRNVGFPAAANQGVRAAGGSVIVLLNNDTIVPPGWLSRLAAHSADPEVGMVGPVTNRIGNEAEIDVSYRTYGEFLVAAEQRALQFSRRCFEIRMPAMFCLALRRETYEQLGPLDEQFGLGTLEDDDYAERARRAGYKLRCAEDVLVHHFGEAAFGGLYQDGTHSRLMAENRSRFEAKWRKAWEPYPRRHSPEYERIREEIREVVESRLPDTDDPVVVLSRGDEALVAFRDRAGWHFPQTQDGRFAGHYPERSEDVIAGLEALRARGAGYFVLPSTSLWWLDHYDGFRRYLDERCREVVRTDACVVFALGDSTASEYSGAVATQGSSA